ncbi:hypothetical protein V1264_010720 [Littorina saxatilis]|uniref:Uncharacterized protein n=2 Tax=Littorina saxatilis TaxID=31220 RepID=A0AAN9AQ80_9CAEN
MADMRRMTKAVLCGFLVVFFLSCIESKPATKEEQESNHVLRDTAGQTENIHQQNQESQDSNSENVPGQAFENVEEQNQAFQNVEEQNQAFENVEEQNQAFENVEEQNQDSENAPEHNQAFENVQEHNQDSENVPENNQAFENVQEQHQDSENAPEQHQAFENQAFADHEVAQLEAQQEEPSSNSQDNADHIVNADQPVDGVQGGLQDPERLGQEQYQAGKVEELVHGDGNVHAASHQDKAEEEGEGGGEGGGSEQFGAVEVEHLMHAQQDAHGNAPEQGKPDDAIKGEFKAGDVEQMVHGNEGEAEGQGEGHVHDSDPDAKKAQGPYKVGDIDILGKDSLNVHDPKSRDQMASAGDVSALMGVGGGGGGEEEKKEGLPTVADGEHLMHGDGGHDHDVKQLKFIKTKEDSAAQDRFQDVHGLVMHSADSDKDHDHDKDKDETIKRGKTISYKDIMALGLDEERLKGVDLKKLLLDNVQEYDDWQRDREVIPGESPEASFWEQIGELRKRYLSFGHNDGEAKDLTGSKLDPDQQRWVAGAMGEGEGADGGEDSIMHQMEILGNTAPKQDRHKHARQEQHDEYQDNRRDIADL